MATIQSIKTLENCRVTPFTDSAEFSLPLTYSDFACFKYNLIERVLFYQLAENESTHSFFNSVLLPKLKHSLSLTLTHFLPVAGNIIWPDVKQKPSVLYTPGDRVSLIVAESNSDLNRLSQNEMQEAVALHPYIPELVVTDSKAEIVAFQITFFPSQGFSVGVTMHHTIFDGKSVALLLKSWAHLCKEYSNSDRDATTTTLLPLEITPVFDRTVVDDPQGLDMVYLNNWSIFDPNAKSLRLVPVTRDTGNLVRAEFELSRQEITNLRRKIISQLNNGDENDSTHMRLSTFVLSYAYITVSMVKAKQLERKGKIGLAFEADCRSRLNPALPTNYFGNCIVGSSTSIDTKLILEKNGMASVAYKLTKMIKELDTRVKDMSIEGANERTLKFTNMMKSFDLFIAISGSPRFESYGVDFGWGKPKKIQHVSIDKNVSISMKKSWDGNGGIEVGLALKKNEMEIFSSLFLNGLKDM